MRRGPVGQQGNQPPSNPLHRLHRLHRLHQLLQVPPRRSAHPRATVKTSRTATSGGLGLPLTIFYYQQGPRYILHILRRLATLSTIVSIIFFFFSVVFFLFLPLWDIFIPPSFLVSMASLQFYRRRYGLQSLVAVPM